MATRVEPETVDLTADDPVDHVEIVDVSHHEETPPPKKRRSTKREQMEREYEQYLSTLNVNERIRVRRSFDNVRQQKDNLIKYRHQLNNESKRGGEDISQERQLVDGALCQIDEWAMSIRNGRASPTDVEDLARSAANIAGGVRSRIEGIRTSRAISRLQASAVDAGRRDLLEDPMYVEGRSNSLVAPSAPGYAHTTYTPEINPESASYALYRDALQNQQNPGLLPDGSRILPASGRRDLHLPFYESAAADNTAPGNTPPVWSQDVNYEALVDLAMSEAEPLDMPPQMNCSVLEHQRQGLGWLVRAEKGRNRGGILADDMGLGKTVQTIGVIYAHPPDSQRFADQRQTLIICPVALIQTWAEELKRRVHEPYRMRVYIHHASTNSRLYTRAADIKHNADIVICTYHGLVNEYKQVLRRNEGRSHGPFPLFEIRWHRVVLDEAHLIKNRNTQMSIAASMLRARHRLALTGTPMQNGLEELYPLVRFLHIEPYWPTWGDFKALVPMSQVTNDLRFESQKALIAFLSAIMLRRRKETEINGRKIIDNLPVKHLEDVHVAMTGRELEKYEDLEASVKEEARELSASNESFSMNNMLVFLLRLRQQACHPFLMAITSKHRQPSKWGSNKYTRTAIREARVFSPEVAALALETPTTERVCALCQEPTGPLYDSYAMNGCGHPLCLECRNKKHAEMEDSSDGSECPACGLKFYYTANLEILDVLQNNPRLLEADIISLLAARQRPRTETAQAQERARRERLEELQYDSTGVGPPLDILSDSDTDEATPIPEEKPGSEALSTPVEVKEESDDPLRYKVDINEIAKLFKVPGIFTNGWVTSAKVECCLDILRQIWTSAPTEKVIMFSSFTSFLEIMSIPLEAARIPFLQYNGSMGVDDRNAALKEFREGMSQIMLTSLKAGNVGLTLTEANHVIIVEPFWNPYVEEQAMDRVYRIGQSREVTVHRVLIKGTVEDRIVELQNKKREIIESALDPNMKRMAQGLSRSDLLFALGLRSAPPTTRLAPAAATNALSGSNVHSVIHRA